MNNALSCPSCGQIDSVQKVSAIYNQGTSSEFVEVRTSSGNTASGSSISKTKLSEYLAPPERPQTAFGAIFSGAVFFVMFLISFFVTLSLNEFATIFGVLALIMGILSWVGTNSYKQQLPSWERSQEKWESLYYCSRCDGVFSKKDKNLMSVKKVRNWLKN